MGLVRIPHKVRLFAGLLSQDIELFKKVRNRMERALRNRVDFESAIIDFTHTEYYKEEMGPGLKRKFISFERPVSLEDIYTVKIATNKLEKGLSVGGKRLINIDPGYLDLSKLVLFSTKDYTHRIYLKKSIYAEITLYYMDKTFTPWPWTYPDYKTADYIGIFNTLREKYKEEISK